MRPAHVPHAGWIVPVLLAALTLSAAAPVASADHPRKRTSHRSTGLSITFQSGSTFRGGLHHGSARHHSRARSHHGLHHHRSARHHSLTRNHHGLHRGRLHRGHLTHGHFGGLHSRPLVHRRSGLRHHRTLHHRPIVVHQPSVRAVHRPAAVHRPNTVVVRSPRARPIRTFTAPTTTTVITEVYADGWEYLYGEEWDARAAIDAFAGEAERHPHEGPPRVGYALSQALAGNDEKAAWAMRRALDREPESLDEVAMDRHLQRRLNELADGYDRRIREGFTRTDDLFMLAAVRYIQGEYAAAFNAIEAAVEQGDTEASTLALQGLIAQEFDRDPEQ